MKKVIISIAMLIVVGCTVSVHASLILRGTGTSIYGTYSLIYDDDFDITWYDYTRSYDSWGNQVNWSSGLTVDFNGVIYEDWRLPTALNQNGSGPDIAFNCTGSEMGHLYYTELGNLAGGPLSTSFIDGSTGATESFLNLWSYLNWSGTEYNSDPNSAWFFNFYNGDQYFYSKATYFPAIAVYDGDVLVSSPIPEPATLILLGIGLVVAGFVRKEL